MKKKIHVYISGGHIKSCSLCWSTDEATGFIAEVNLVSSAETSRSLHRDVSAVLVFSVGLKCFDKDKLTPHCDP